MIELLKQQKSKTSKGDNSFYWHSTRTAVWLSFISLNTHTRTCTHTPTRPHTICHQGEKLSVVCVSHMLCVALATNKNLLTNIFRCFFFRCQWHSNTVRKGFEEKKSQRRNTKAGTGRMVDEICEAPSPCSRHFKSTQMLRLQRPEEDWGIQRRVFED